MFKALLAALFLFSVTPVFSAETAKEPVKVEKKEVKKQEKKKANKKKVKN